MRARPGPVSIRGWLWLTATVIAISVVVTLSGCANSAPWFRARTPAISVKASAQCPSSVGKARDVSNRVISQTDLLAVSAKPTKGLICVYTGAVSPAGRVHDIVLSASQASRLATVARKVSLRPPPAGTVNCPADTASVAIIALAFNGSPDEDLWWNTSGCQTLDNGTVGATETANNSFSSFQTTASILIG